MTSSEFVDFFTRESHRNVIQRRNDGNRRTRESSTTKMADAVKSIRIKTGSLRRLFKERAMYAEEVVNESAKLNKMKTEGAAGVAQQVRKATATTVTVTRRVVFD
jgi:hypothetical protein